MSTERCFPRGGYSIKETNPKSKTEEHVSQNAESKKLFGQNSKKLKMQHKSRQIDPTVNLEPFSMNVSDNLLPDNVDTLTYQKVQEGMLLLGSVNYVTSMNSIQVQLPGRCYGHISIHDISFEYTKYLTNALQSTEDGNLLAADKQFQPGTFLPVKVLKKITEGKGFRIPLSINPNDVNSNISFNKFSTGMLLWVSVIERSDHCYNLNGGIPNCRVVLPFAKSNFEYSGGENVWCAIQHANIQEHASILTVSTLKEDIQKASLKKNMSLDVLVPGMTVKFQIRKILKDGLRGIICENCTAFIEIVNLSKLTDNPKHYKVGQNLNATLLYIQPVTKFCYLTLQDIFNTPPPCLSVGTKLKGKVFARKDKGIFLSLMSNARGFIPHNRLNFLKDHKKKSDDPAKTTRPIITDKYPKNATLSVRVMDYNYMERTYICTNQSAIVTEKYFSISDLKIGDVVEGIVKEIKHNGVVITVGRVQGFIPNMHLCDVAFTEAIKHKFKLKKKITAKVLSIKPSNVYFTIKRSLMNNDLILSCIDEIDTSLNYPGVIVKFNKNNTQVKFYGDFIGRLSNSEFKDQQYVEDMFYIGQAITTRIASVEDDVPILILSSISNNDVSNNLKITNSEMKQKRKKKRSLSESSAFNGSVKESKVQAVSEKESNNIDSVNSNTTVEEKLHAISKTTVKNVGIKRKRNGTGDFKDVDLEETSDKKRKLIPLEKPPEKEIKMSYKSDKEKSLAIRGMADFFSTANVQTDSDSDSDEMQYAEPNEKKKKKSTKQSASERREKERQEEERLRAVETQLANNLALPQNAEQFERMLLGQSNSSKLWAQYIAFHMQSIEIDKARSVARRALEKIAQTESQERLNIWTVLLNLEHEYGTRDSYDEVFKDAVNCNNSLPIYLLSLENHVVKGEFVEVQSKWRKLRREYKNDLQMWIKVGKIYYENKRFEEARKLRNEGLKTLTDKAMQIDLIVKFAIFEFNYGDLSQGESLFETIIQSDPKRVNVWSTYVDQLVKKNEIEVARRVLDRAVGNKLPFKKMRTLFKKYHEFEKQHGDDEKRTAVEKLAKEYAHCVSAN